MINQAFGVPILYPTAFNILTRSVATPQTNSTEYLYFSIIDVQNTYLSCIWKGANGVEYNGNCMWVCVGY